METLLSAHPAHPPSSSSSENKMMKKKRRKEEGEEEDLRKQKVLLIPTWGGIHEGPSRYRDYKANRPDSYSPCGLQQRCSIHECRSAGTTAIGSGIFKSLTAHAYTKECALFLPGAGVLSVFRVDRRLLAVFLCMIPVGFVQWLVSENLVNGL